MKNGVKKLGKRFVVIILVISMCLQTGVAATRGYEKTVVKHVLGEDGHYYSMELTKTSEEILTLQVIDETTHEMFIAKYNQGCVYATKQEYYGKDFLGRDKYNVTFRERYDFSGILKGQVNEVSTASYGSKVVMALPYKSNGTYYDFYYRIGTSAPDKGYAEIGCVRKYRVEITGPFVQDYIGKVDECNMYYSLSGVTAGGVAVLAAVAVVGIMTGTAMIAFIAGVLGLGVDTAGVNAIVNCYMAYKAADRFFDLAKEYGERIY